jgi:DNA replication licensing factor MCM2
VHTNQSEEEEEDEGEDLLENVQRDYQRIDALDTYGTEGMDYAEYDIDPEHREAAEQELARRDNEAGRRQDGFYGLLDTVEDEEDEEARMARRGNFRREEAEEDVTDEEDFDGEDQVNLEAFEVPLREWIAQDRTRIEIQRRFRAFLRHFTPTTTTTDNEDTARRRRRGNGS